MDNPQQANGFATETAGTGVLIETSPQTSLETMIDLSLRHGLGPDELERRLRRAHRAGDVGARAQAFYLCEVQDRRAYEAWGYSNLFDYVERRIGIAPTTAREYIKVGRALAELPEVDRAFALQQLTWSHVRELVRIVAPETQLEWIERARTLTARELAAEVRDKQKGQRPSDPKRRRIHTTKFPVNGKLDVTRFEMWNAGRARLEAGTRRIWSDDDMLAAAAKLFQTLPIEQIPDAGPVKGPVNDAHYRVPMHVIEIKGPDGAETTVTTISTPDGPVALDPRIARAALLDAGYEVPASLAEPPEPTPEELAEAVERARQANEGPPVPLEQRDKPASPALVSAVLERDGLMCRCCGRRDNLTGHHKIYRSHGGKTDGETLLGVCEGCHSLVHDGLIVVVTLDSGEVRFVDKDGRDLKQLGGDGVPGLTMSEPETAAPADRPPDGARAPRPARLADLVGQERAVGALRRAVAAARADGSAVPHVLLAGGPGLGKTSLACAVAAELDTGFSRIGAPALARTSDLCELLRGLGERDVLFIDEVHRLPSPVAELLYEAMEERTLSISVREDGVRRTMTLPLRPFTLVGATTDDDLLPASFRDRFGIREDLEHYSQAELREILLRASGSIGISLSDAAARRIASVSRDTPRVALRFLETVRAEGVILGTTEIDEPIVQRVLESMGIDEMGLKPLDRRFLAALARHGTLGLGSLAAHLGTSEGALRVVHEPYLIRRGLVERTRYGRTLGPTRNTVPCAPAASA